MYTHGCATWHALVSRLVVVIHYETMSIRYLGTICFCYVRFIISVSSIMVSWLMTYSATTKLRAPCECTRKVMLLGACWYRSLWSWSIVELHLCVIFRGLLPWNDFGVVCRSDQATSVISIEKKAYHFPVWSLSFDLSSDYLYKFPLRPLCKGEAVKLFSVERQLISSQMEINFPCCWDAGVCSFAPLFNPCTP
jgi:hypothetical protein